MKTTRLALAAIVVLSVSVCAPAMAANTKPATPNTQAQAQASDVWFWYDQPEYLMEHIYRPVVQSAATWLTKRDWVDAVCGSDKACRKAFK